MLKRLTMLAAPLISALGICTASVAFASDANVPIDITINGNYIKTDCATYETDGTSFVPIRSISDALGASLEWNEDEKKATITRGETIIILYEDKKQAYVNDKPMFLSHSVRITNDKLFVPVRFLAESFGALVAWNEKYHNIEITLAGVYVDSAYIDTSYTSDDIFWLARIVHAESRGEPMRGKIGVANVILNRVKSSSFPNTIYDVIFDRRFGIQFNPAYNGAIYNNPSMDSFIAAKRALRGENTVGNSLYFFNPRIASSSWISNNRRYYTTINNHAFYL